MRCPSKTFLIFQAILAVALFFVGIGMAQTQPSINSTGQNKTSLPVGPVRQSGFVNLNNFRAFAVNDLGMHCGDLDHRVVSILPPFNTLHALVIRRGALPQKMNDSPVSVFYSAASNPKDPALQRAPTAPVYKTDFWQTNPRTGRSYAFDAYDPFYPPGILPLFPLAPDIGLPVPDVWRLYLGDGKLVASQQSMPSVSSLTPPVSNPYALNRAQAFKRFDTVYPFFITFPFGYTLTSMDWFSADGIPIAPYDDYGRANSYPLMRIQARDRTGSLTGTRNRILATVDTVLPVAAEVECFACHTSSVDGGNGQAACIPGRDANCPAQGSPANRSGVRFRVTRPAQDTANVPPKVKREWAADWNVLRLHDAKHGTTLARSTPVVCQRCHYSPALDLAHLGPIGPGDAAANGREQKIHQTNSRVIHSFHGKLDLFQVRMPPPTDPRRQDPKTGLPMINNFVKNILNRTCYQCHPGRETKCLRGAMFNAGLVCQDCHGRMQHVGNDFSAAFPKKPFPGGADLNRRIPWADEPACQSCHTGDALTTLARKDPKVIRAKDGIRLLQAYRVGDPTAKPIEAPNSRFAENRINGNRVLYRLSKDVHMGVFCEACHGSTHAEWPVQPFEGAEIANDNLMSLQLQKHPGKITECTVCHGNAPLPSILGGPHGMHPVNASSWIADHHDFLGRNSLNTCRACHGLKGQGTVLAKTPVKRTLRLPEGGTVNIEKNRLVGCSLCHENPL